MGLNKQTSRLAVKARKKRRSGIAILPLLLIGIGLLIGALLGVALSVTRDMPQIQALETYAPSAATRVYAADGSLVTQFYIHRRFPVPSDSLPEDLKKAIIAIEDRRFYQHTGLDVIRNFGALINDIRARRLAEGASTITQQLTRNLFLTPEKTISRKLKEIFLSFQIEHRYTKDEILALYLNQIHFGHGSYGVGSAAEVYFGKKVYELTLPECALLAGLVRAPAIYSPFNHPERAQGRRTVVLRAMLRDGYITQERFDRADKAPLGLVGQKKDRILASYFSEYVRRLLLARFGQDMVYKGGLEVHTTLDTRMQRAAEKSLENWLPQLAQRLRAGIQTPTGPEKIQTALIALEPGTGRILAMVGGADFSESSYNRAVQALRQPGSAFKPIIYATAIEKGRTQADLILDAPLSFDLPGRDEPWQPQNYNLRFEGEITLRHALEDSINIPAIKLLSQVGIDRVINTAHRLGITAPLSRNLSLALGTSEVTLVELVAAYNALAGGGLWVEPWGIEEIKDQSGIVLFKAKPERSAVLTPETAYIITDMLKSVITDGTGRKAQVLGRPLAGKTGTTDDFRNALFIGFSPELTAGVWVGYDSNHTLGRGATGAETALPAWIAFMEQALRDKPVSDFQRPAGVVMVPMDRVTGQPAQAGSSNAVEAAFRVGDESGD